MWDIDFISAQLKISGYTKLPLKTKIHYISGIIFHCQFLIRD